MSEYQCIIDLHDIVSAQKIRTQNESSKYIHDPEVKKFYKYDYFIQMTLSTVDGNTLKELMKLNEPRESFELKIDENRESERRKSIFQTFHLKNIKPVASVFFRFSHRDKQN